MAHMIMNIDQARSYIKPETFTTFPASLAGRLSATAAIFPPEIATSTTLSIPLAGSTMAALQKKVVMRRLRLRGKLRLNRRDRF